MKKGINKANKWERLSWLLESKEITGRPCVFLSHKREDKPVCRKIAEYFSNAEIDYYLDELDDILQQATAESDSKQITKRYSRKHPYARYNIGKDLSVSMGAF
jgi:hypothetical protein